MNARLIGSVALGAAFLLVAGCASSAAAQKRRQEAAAEIEEILSLPVPPQLGGNQRCLAEHELSGIRILDDKHVVFVNRDDRLWINTLPQRCVDLRSVGIVTFKPSTGTRICRHDKFRTNNMRLNCRLGAFQPVTAEQLAEIAAVLERR